MVFDSVILAAERLDDGSPWYAFEQTDPYILIPFFGYMAGVFLIAIIAPTSSATCPKATTQSLASGLCACPAGRSNASPSPGRC